MFMYVNTTWTWSIIVYEYNDDGIYVLHTHNARPICIIRHAAKYGHIDAGQVKTCTISANIMDTVLLLLCLSFIIL